MEYLHYEVEAGEGDVVEVVLDRAANVQLLDPADFEKYKTGRGFRYYGGYATASPVRLPVPGSGRWHVVIDLGGGAGHVRASVQLLAATAA